MLPASLKVAFAPCYPSEGALAMTVTQSGEEKLLPATVDWLAGSEGHWHLQMTDPLGRSLYDLVYNGRSLRAQRNQRAKITLLEQGDMRVGSTGLLSVKGHEVALRASEIPCLFKGNLPLAWESSLAAVERSQEHDTLFFEEDDRRIEVAFEHGEGLRKIKRICSTLAKPYLWGLASTDLVWCFEPKTKRGELTVPNGSKVAWILSDG